MTLSLDSATKDFQEKLRRKAAAKKAIGPVKLKLDKSKPDLLAQMCERLDEIYELLKQGKSAPTKFVVTERDSNGEIKSFQVE
jgi:hypothetical protein